MRCEYIFIRSLTCLLFFLLSERLLASGESESDYSRGCAHLRCENGSRCVKRRFWCKAPPCPGMLYCSKSRKELLRGPLTCDTVLCNEGHRCIVKVRGCNWDGKCKQQLARCVSEKEYEGAASCVGFECPSGERCILRETHCVNPPCKLARSCESAEDVRTWFERCKSLNCASEYECFLRRPENNCLDSRCTHTPDCTFTIEDELSSKYCYGWICPRAEKCVVRVVDSCKGFNCTVERSCLISSVSPAKHNEPISPVTSTRKENIYYTTSTKLEVSLTHQQTAMTKLFNLITESTESSTNEPDLTSPYSRSRLNNKFSTIDENKVFQSSTTTSPTNGKTEPATSDDTQRLEVPRKIYITTDDALPLPIMLEDINFFGQGYPIWIKNDPYHSLQAKDEKWRYYAPQEPYKILLPPYEPVILVEDARREQFLPFLTDEFDRLLNEAVLISLPEVTPTDIGDSETDSTSPIADDKNNTNNSTVVEVGNIRANHSDDLSDNHESSLTKNRKATEKPNTAPPSIRDEEVDNYDNYEWYMIHDYPERDEPQSSHEQESINSSIVHLATDDFYRNDTLAETPTRSEITEEKRSRVSEMRYVDGRNKNLATLSPSASTEQSDYSTRNENGPANYPRDTISVHQIGKPSRVHGESSLKQILDVPSNEEGNQRDIPITFPFDQLLGGRANVQ